MRIGTIQSDIHPRLMVAVRRAPSGAPVASPRSTNLRSAATPSFSSDPVPAPFTGDET
jgi:hypothetical protein